MKTALTVIALLGLSSAIALADDTNTDQNAGDTVKAAQDCTQLEGEAKTKCEQEQAEAQAETPQDDAAVPEKGGKSMNKSNDNRMESFDEDE